MFQSTLFRQYSLTLISIPLSLVLLANSLPYWLRKSQAKIPLQIAIKEDIKHTLSEKIPLNNYPLFGQTVESQQSEITNTRLNLKLVGILEASNTKESQAWISIEDNKEKLYFVNDKINQNTILWRILKNAVLLKRNGKIEKLSLPKLPLNMRQTSSPDIPHKEDTF